MRRALRGAGLAVIGVLRRGCRGRRGGPGTAGCCLETKMRQPDTAAEGCCWLPGLAAGGGAVQPPWLRNGVNKPAGPRHHHQQPSQGWRVSPRIFPSSDHRRPSPGQMGHKQEFLSWDSNFIRHACMCRLRLFVS